MIDTVWKPYDTEFVARLKEEIDLKKIDYVIMNHNEIDHSGEQAPRHWRKSSGEELFLCLDGLAVSEGYADAVQQHIYENVHVALDQTTYNKKRDSLTARYNSLKERIEDLNVQIIQTQSQKGSIEDFLIAFEKLPETITKFDEALWGSMVDHLTVYKKDNIVFTLTSGMEIKA